MYGPDTVVFTGDSSQQFEHIVRVEAGNVGAANRVRHRMGGKDRL